MSMDSVETGVLDIEAALVRTMRTDDLNAVVAIDAAASGRRRPRYFELMLQRGPNPGRPSDIPSGGSGQPSCGLRHWVRLLR